MDPFNSAVFLIQTQREVTPEPAEPVAEPATEPVAEPAGEPEVESDIEPVVEPAPEVESAPVAEAEPVEAPVEAATAVSVSVPDATVLEEAMPPTVAQQEALVVLPESELITQDECVPSEAEQICPECFATAREPEDAVLQLQSDEILPGVNELLSESEIRP